MQLFRKLTRDVRSYVQKVSYIVTLSRAKDFSIKLLFCVWKSDSCFFDSALTMAKKSIFNLPLRLKQLPLA
jgi:hypothetical protein